MAFRCSSLSWLIALSLVSCLWRGVCLPEAYEGCLDGTATTFVAHVTNTSARVVQPIEGRHAVKGFGAARVYFVSREDAPSPGAEGLPGVKRVERVPSEWKLASLKSVNELGLMVVLNLGRYADDAEGPSYCERAKGKIEQALNPSRESPAEAWCTTSNRVVLKGSFTSAEAERIAEERFVSLVTPRVKGKPMNFEAIPLAQGGQVRHSPLWEKGYTGSGQVLGMTDTGINQGHCAFEGRVKKYFERGSKSFSETDNNGHGTHVAGTAIGKDGARFPDGFSGMAPDAEIVVSDVETADGSLDIPDDLGTLFADEREEGVTVSSHSWGLSDVDVDYGSFAVDMDKEMRDHGKMLIVVSAGNSGGDGDETITTPADAKNVMAVGAGVKPSRCESLGCDPSSFVCFNDCPSNSIRVADFSSRGPTSDGRRKPDILATGNPVFSADYREACFETVRVLGGTSMAAPAVSGAALLLREWLVKEQSIDSPRNTLLRAGLAVTAKTLPGEEEKEQGLGHLILNTAIDGHELIKDSESVQEGEERVFDITPGESGNVAAAVAWNDVPSEENDPGLVNKLDVELSCGEKNPVRDESDSSTLKKVTLPSVSEGVSCSLKVSGRSVPDSPQQFSAFIARVGPTSLTLDGFSSSFSAPPSPSPPPPTPVPDFR